MSYDIYCYKSQLGKPDLEEAKTLIEVDDEMENISESESKHKIANALTDYNPRLENFEFDYNEIAKLQGITINEAKQEFNYIELNTTEGDLATQITILDNNVIINIPFWYSGDNAKEVFDKIYNYTKIIRQSEGYFVYDPQTEKAFDPLIENLFGLDIYENMTKQVEKMKMEQTQKIGKKYWWKFW